MSRQAINKLWLAAVWRSSFVQLFTSLVIGNSHHEFSSRTRVSDELLIPACCAVDCLLLLPSIWICRAQTRVLFAFGTFFVFDENTFSLLFSAPIMARGGVSMCLLWAVFFNVFVFGRYSASRWPLTRHVCRPRVDFGATRIIKVNWTCQTKTLAAWAALLEATRVFSSDNGKVLARQSDVFLCTRDLKIKIRFHEKFSTTNLFSPSNNVSTKSWNLWHSPPA